MLYIREEADGVLFKVRVQPRAAKNQVAGLYENALKLRLTAPPVEGEANEACRSFIAGLLSVPRSQVEVVSGHTSRTKVVKVTGVRVEKILKAFGL